MAGQRLTDGTMRVAVIYEAGGPEVLKLENRQIPRPVCEQRHYRMQMVMVTSYRRKARF